MKPHLALIGLFILASARVVHSDETARTNVLLILLDNVGYGDLRCYGNGDVRTPNLDSLASEGVRCTGFYIASPSCSPSRGAILTGRHPLRNGLNYQLTPGEKNWTEGLPESERIIPQYLHPLGYQTAAFGKWNIGFRPGIRPTERGFNEFLGHRSGNIHYFKYLYHGENDLRVGTEPLDRRGHYSTDLFADSAIDFIRRNVTNSWFVYLPFNAAHFVGPHNVELGEKVEWQVPVEYLALYGYAADEADQKKRFRAVLTALDAATGRVLRAIDELQLRDRTLVIFLSDNGAFMLEGRGLEVQSNRPLRGGGVATYEGGICVPAIFRWPGRIPPGTVCREVLSSLDILPMILTATGAVSSPSIVLDGQNPTKTLAGESPTPHKSLYWEWKQGRNEHWRAIRSGDYKLVRSSDVEPWELYDLSQDISESKNLAALAPATVKSLAEEFDRWRSGIGGK